MNRKNSEIIICKNIRLDKDYRNVLNYTESNMVTLCRSLAVRSANNFSFIKPGKNEILVSFTYDDCLKCNYMAFQNPYYSNKWFFAFIDSVEYQSESSTRINFTIDEYSTWFDYWNPKACFVLREHTNDDTPGNNTQPEGLELGEYMEQVGVGSVHVDNFYFLNQCYPVVALAEWPLDVAVQEGTKMYNGVYSGFYYLAFKTPHDLDLFISDIQDDEIQDIIYSIFMVPKAICDIQESDFYKPSGHDFYMAFIPYSTESKEVGSLYITDGGVLDTNYVPRNKKLLTFPYRYILINNNAGSSMDYHYELFNSTQKVFKIFGAISIGCNIKIFPYGYNTKNSEVVMNNKNYLYGLDGGKLPTCSWYNDPYTNWLTQNSVNNAIDIGKGVAKIIGGTIATAVNPVVGTLLIANGGMDIIDNMKERYDHSLAPITGQGGVNQGDLMFAEKKAFEYHMMSIKREYAIAIDNYFDKYGYNTNRIKFPNQTGRRYWNYVQIGKSEDIGYSTNNTRSVPANSMLTINNIYRNGVTIWHNHDNLGDYSLNNTII